MGSLLAPGVVLPPGGTGAGLGSCLPGKVLGSLLLQALPQRLVALWQASARQVVGKPPWQAESRLTEGAGP